MENKTNVTKGMYLLMVWCSIFIGIIIMSICTYLFLFKIETNYSFYFNLVGGMLIGYGMGLATSRSYNIQGYD